MLFHPTEMRLGLFADGTLPPAAVKRVARHLQRCGRCRARVTATRRLSHDARDLRIPPLPTGLRRRVLHGLATGDQVIVPVADPRAPGWPWRRLLWAGVGALVLIVGGTRLVFDNRLFSEASVLAFTPAAPTAGDEVTVTYHATGQFGAAPALRLRAQYRQADDRGDRGLLPIAAEPLRPRGNRTFEARVRLPAGVVYAAFAVEDEAGTAVDYGGSPGWELLVHAEGHPTYDALRQRVDVAMGRDLGEALEAAIEATRLYPDRVEAWSIRGSLEAEAYGPGAYDSLRTVHARQIHAFDRLLGSTPVPADVMGAMYLYAGAWNVADVAERWRERALREAPQSAIAVRLRTVDILRQSAAHPREGLRLLDSLYAEAGRAPLILSTAAFTQAYGLKDPQASLRWARRVIAVEPRQQESTLRQLLTFSSLSDTVLALVEREIERLEAPGDVDRPLSWNTPRYLRSVRSARLGMLGLKGQALVDLGDTLAALAYLDSAVAEGWDPARFRMAAMARLAAADTLGAVQLLARVAIDPATQGDWADRSGRGLVDEPAWTAERERARHLMLRETQRDAQPRVLFDPVRVTRRSGDTVDLRETLQGHVTAVAFWHPACRACLADLQALRQLVAALPAAPRLVIVSRRPLGPAEWALLDDADLSPIVSVDAENAALHVFGVWATARVFVLDRRGVVQYQGVSAQDVPRYVMALVRTHEVVMDPGATDPRGTTAKAP